MVESNVETTGDEVLFRLLTVLAFFAGSVSAQTLPRTADGKPDLQGIWRAANRASYDLESHAARHDMPAGHSVVDGGKIPYQPWATAKKRENFEQRMTVDPWNRDLGDPEVKCYLPGVPRATYLPYPFQIVQGTDEITIAYEFSGATRLIHLRDHQQPAIDSWMGWSNGRWDGDTLVVDVTGFNGLTWFDRAGNFHSADMTVVERYTLTGPNMIEYSATIEDSNVFTRPWTITMPLYRRVDRDALVEFKCVEFVEELIYGQWRKNPLDR